MPLEGQITFGTSGLDRASAVRSDPVQLASARAHAGATTLAFWRGKPLLNGAGLARLPLDHPVLRDGHGDPMLLGFDDAVPVFALDLRNWDPAVDVTDPDSFLDRSEQQHPGLPDTYRFAELRAAMTGLSRRDAELAATGRAVLGWHATHEFCARCGAGSEVIEGGWQRICPSCGARHFPRTDPVVIMLILHGNSVLVGRSPQWPDRMYSLLAGFVEPGETIEAAVRREVFEEAGIRVGDVRYIASQPWPYPSSLMLGCLGLATSTDIRIDPVEIEDAMWVTREEMVDVFAGTHPQMREPRRGAIAHSLIQHWLSGATGPTEASG